MFGNFAADLNREIKIPKGIVSMLKSFGLDAKAIETQVLKMGKDAISLLEHCDGRLTQLALQHQLLHEEKQKLVVEVARLHSRFDSLEQRIVATLATINFCASPSLEGQNGKPESRSNADRAIAS